jgi:hypothetical protein
MSAQALDYQLKQYFGLDDNPLLVYYDFEKNNVFTVQSGSVYQSYLRNIYPASMTGVYDAKIINASGSTSQEALDLTTGLNKFINSTGDGDFTKNYIEISGSSSIPLKDCSYIFSIEPTLSENGVIFGAYEDFLETIDGFQVNYTKGFNLGVNDRGKLFFNSSSTHGEYCFVANDIELSEKNVVGLNFTNSSCKIFRFDYLNNEVESQEFYFDASIMEDNNIYLGSSKKYFRNPQENLYSGIIDDFAIFSGQVPENYLFEISKAFVAEYYENPGEVSTVEVISGYATEYIYKTGITGTQSIITGYDYVKSGIDSYQLVENETTITLPGEGNRYFTSRDLSGSSVKYSEEVGLLLSGSPYDFNYDPNGENALSTLGLQSGEKTVTNSEYQWVQTEVTVEVPLYQTIYLTGTTNEISGVINTPIYTTGYITGAGESGILISSDTIKLQKDYIYFMGQR